MTRESVSSGQNTDILETDLVVARGRTGQGLHIELLQDAKGGREHGLYFPDEANKGDEQPDEVADRGVVIGVGQLEAVEETGRGQHNLERGHFTREEVEGATLRTTLGMRRTAL